MFFCFTADSCFHIFLVSFPSFYLNFIFFVLENKCIIIIIIDVDVVDVVILIIIIYNNKKKEKKKKKNKTIEREDGGSFFLLIKYNFFFNINYALKYILNRKNATQ